MKDLFLSIIGLAFIAIGCYMAYLFLLWLVTFLQNTNPTIGTGIIAGSVTIISSVWIASYNARKAKERAAFEAHKEYKLQLYLDFMNQITGLLKKNKSQGSKGEVLPKDLEGFFFNFTSKIMVYGGPAVIKAYGNWRLSSNTQDPQKSLLLMDRLFMEIRLDIGESNREIGPNELLGLLILGGKPELDKLENGDHDSN